jgi:GDP-L-fucose synthase
MREEYLLTGPLEPTNEGYALAKIAGLRLAQYYHREYGMDVVLPMPCNLYGPGDTFDLERSHVLSALVRRFVDARDARLPKVELWGTGQARREFMHVDDLVRAIELLMSSWKRSDIVNVGTGDDVTIRDLATLVATRVGYSGDITWDPTKPDGMPRKCLDVSLLRSLGFESQIPLAAGIDDVIREYSQYQAERR